MVLHKILYFSKVGKLGEKSEGDGGGGGDGGCKFWQAQKNNTSNPGLPTPLETGHPCRPFSERERRTGFKVNQFPDFSFGPIKNWEFNIK